jgi:predicted negative regulator of RcsB-dependent stress response
MAYDLEEQEQLAQLKAWWEKYGTITLGLLSLALVVVLGWQGWNWYENSQSQQARGYYEALERAASQPSEDSVARIEAASQALQKNFAQTDYAARAALVASDALAEQGQLQAAQQPLTWLAGSSHAALAPVAKLRLAGLLLDEGQYDQALAALDAAPDSFKGLYADRRGDILAAQGKQEEAVAAWREALETLGPTDALSNVVQLKIDTIGS